MINRRMVIPTVAAGAVGLVGCGTAITVASIAAAIQSACGIVVVVEQLTQALLGIDLSKLNVTQFVTSVCDQFSTVASSGAPPVTPPAGLGTAAGAPARTCYTLMINGKPVVACK